MMFISRFNALIRNKIIWGGIAFIVVMAFVLWDTQTGGDRAEADVIGMLDGKPVGRAEFGQAYFSTYLSMCLSMGRRLNITADMEPVLNRMAWKRLATLRAAADLELPVTSDEVVAAIREQPFFAVNGGFSPERYHSFVRGFLADLGASESQFEEFMRQEIVLGKMRYVLAQSAWVPPREVTRIYHRFYDDFLVKYVALLRDELDHMVEITREDARSLFERDPERFLIPERVSVKYVSFPVEDFVDETAVGDELLQQYYDEYVSARIEMGRDEWDTIPLLDEIKDEVRREAAWNEAEIAAGERAFAFELMMAPDRAGRAPTFEEAAAEMGLLVSTSAYFAVEDRIEALDVGRDFNEAAFRLRPTPEERFSYPVQGAEAFYVLGYHERLDSRVPEFEEVEDAAMLAATEETIGAKLKELASDIRDEMEEDIREGVSFKESAASFGLEVFTFGPFSVTARFAEQDYEDSEESYMLMTYAISCDAGELTDVIPLEKGYLIGYVKEREPASRTTYTAIRNDLVEYVLRARKETVFGDWQSHLLSSAGFEDLAARRRYEPDDNHLDP